MTFKTKIRGWWNSEPSNRLLKVNMVIAVFGVAASILLSFITLRLTFKYGENKDQLDKLTRISSQQQQQLLRLGAILDQVRKGTANSDLLIQQMKNSNDRLVGQTTLLTSQLSILSSGQKLNVRLQSLSEKASFKQVKDAAIRMFDPSDERIVEVINNKNPEHPERVYFIEHIRDLLKQQLSNSFLLEHDKNDREWNSLYASSMVLLSFENITTGTVTYSDHGKTLSRTQTNQELEKEHIDMFEKFVGEARDLSMELLKTIDELKEVNHAAIKTRKQSY